jgi:hypothetical protein
VCLCVGGNNYIQQSKRERLDLPAGTDLTSQETCLVDELDARNQLQQEENWVELQQRNNRLPVSIAELNIKPYKCLRCGFRSDRKSDTLRHIRVKHSLSNQAVKFLRIMSIKEASDSIEEYENFRLYKKIKNFKNNGASSGADGEDNSATGSIPSTGEELGAAMAGADLQDVSERSAEEECGSSATWSGLEDFACAGGVGRRRLGSQSKADKQSRCSPADLYRCPFCSFKNAKKMVMRRHLVIHFSGAQAVCVTNPVYRCSLCTFRSKWQFFVKKHITTHHLSVKNAYVLRYPARSAHQRLDREDQQQQMNDQNGSDEDQDGRRYQNGLEQEDNEDGAAPTAESGSLETEVTVEQGDVDAAAADADWSEQNNNQENQDENNRHVHNKHHQQQTTTAKVVAVAAKRVATVTASQQQRNFAVSLAGCL